MLWDGNKKINYSGGAPWYDRELIPPVGLKRHFVSPTHEHVDFTYFAYAESDKVVPEKLDDEWHWLKKDELDKLELLPNIKFWAERALDTLSS